MNTTIVGMTCDPEEPLATIPAAPLFREAWVPYLVDRADGVQGHFAIARWNPAGYREVWNLRTHQWSSFSDDVLTADEAFGMLRTISFHPMTPSLRSPQ